MRRCAAPAACALRGQARHITAKASGEPTASLKRLPRPLDGERAQAQSSHLDEYTRELFGVDHVPWVHVVKNPVTTGAADPEHHLLWELPVYTQASDPRNDWPHRIRQGVPERLPTAEHPMAGDGRHLYGMYPDRFEDNPGEFWKGWLNKSLLTGMTWERSKLRSKLRYGGPFALPGDDYNTREGVLPLLSGMGFRHVKYSVHEPCLRELNAAVPAHHQDRDGDIDTLLQTYGGVNERLSGLAADHHGFCYFYKSVRPRGNVMRDELREELESAFGSVDELKTQFEAAAQTVDGDGFVWLALDRETDSVRLTALPKGRSPLGEAGGLEPLLCCPLHEAVWSTDWESKAEFVAKFFGAADWEFVTQRLAHLRGQPAPDPLVF